MLIPLMLSDVLRATLKLTVSGRCTKHAVLLQDSPPKLEVACASRTAPNSYQRPMGCTMLEAPYRPKKIFTVLSATYCKNAAVSLSTLP